MTKSIALPLSFAGSPFMIFKSILSAFPPTLSTGSSFKSAQTRDPTSTAASPGLLQSSGVAVDASVRAGGVVVVEAATNVAGEAHAGGVRYL